MYLPLSVNFTVGEWVHSYGMQKAGGTYFSTERCNPDGLQKHHTNFVW
ncbi:MAG: hypothetical protein LBC68_12220 [Prevotellaceae bacterium]|nr:hypothetical protein [Prevotellaceae bacterium]